MREILYTCKDEIVFTYTNARGRKCGFVLLAKSQEESDIIWKTASKILKFMKQTDTVINYSGLLDKSAGENHEQKT